MSEPFLAEIRMVGFTFAPRGWALCNGQLLPINQNQALFSLLGTTYGGNGQTTFALPDLRGRTPIHTGQASGGTARTLGSQGGEEAHTLTVAELPQHGHALKGSGSTAASSTPSANVLAAAPASVGSAYAATGAPQNTALAAGAIANAGGSQGHANMMPHLVLNFCIALQGIFPSPN